MLPEIPYCESHYLPPDSKYITCEQFGNSDGMNGECWNCKDMTLYQWYMCQEQTILEWYIKHGYTLEQSKQLIDAHKNSMKL